MGKGGGPDLSGIEQATEEATKLQQQVYQDALGLTQPYTDFGQASVGRLSDLLGLSGGSMQSRQQVYDELLPQYTQTIGSGTPSSLVSKGGQVIDLAGVPLNDIRPDRPFKGEIGSQLSVLQDRYNRGQDYSDIADAYGFSVLGDIGGQTQSTDYDALNTAVEERLAGQETPEGFGSLLERFSETEFEQDPGYQFRQSEAQKALERSMSAQGVTLGGGGFGSINPQVARALEEQSQGLAAQEYQSAYNRYVNDQLNTYNMLMGGAGLGQSSIGTAVGSGQTMATNVGNLQTGLAQSQLEAQMAQQSQPSLFGTALGIGSTLLGAPSGSVFASLLGS